MSTIFPMPVPFVDDSIKVIGVNWRDERCTQVEVLSKRASRTFVVEFDSVIGLRMLHELDLAGFWLNSDKQVLSASWLFEVSAGGWFDLESGRDDFYTKHQDTRPIEFIVAGYQQCVSILSASYPRVFESTGDDGPNNSFKPNPHRGGA